MIKYIKLIKHRNEPKLSYNIKDNLALGNQEGNVNKKWIKD